MIVYISLKKCCGEIVNLTVFEVIRLISYLHWFLTKKSREEASQKLRAEKFAHIKAQDQNGYEICLLGDSLIEYWNNKSLANKRCFNAGVGATTSKDVYNCLQNGLLNGNFSYFIIILGTNDIKSSLSLQVSLSNIAGIFDYLKTKYPTSKYYYYLTPPVNRRWDRSNKNIEKLNVDVSKVVPKYVMQMNFDYLKDSKGNLNKNYTVDGLHFNNAAYSLVEQELNKIIK